ncbi:MFS transporter [Miniimonas sp. S16]|uniref:MFS transporter n=1 Tax=Miniimonas sp. S16 TaxID=2171623 RepID=UPI000D527076|nr:MFS transporter [Miniimonas sp. S16]
MATTASPDIHIPRQAWYRTTVSGMASYLDAAAIISTGTALVLYQDQLGLTAGHIGGLSAILTFLMAAGALVGGRLGDLYGRRRVFMVTMALYTVGAALMLTAGSVGMLYVGVAALGFAVGADLPVSLAMIAEGAPKGARGKLISFSHILWLVGILASQLLGIIVGNMGFAGGRILYAHLVVVAIVTLVLRARIPESAQWAAAHHGEVVADASGDKVDVGTLKQLLRGPFLAPMIAVSLFYALVNVGANTGGQFSTFMYVNIAGSTVRFASTVSFITFLIAFAATYLLMRIVDGRNRMRWFAVMAVIYTLGYVLPAVLGAQVWTLVTMGVIGSIAGAIAGEPMFKIWAQELFPTVYRSTAQGVMIAVTRVVAALVALWTPALLEASPSILFWFVAACIAAGGLIGVFWISRYPKVADAEPDTLAAQPTDAPVIDAPVTDAPVAPSADGRVQR